MSAKPDLHTRFLKFMVAVNKKNPELWVRRDKLKDYAFNEGYRSQAVWDAFEKLDNDVRIGRIFQNGARYIYYDFPAKQVKQMGETIKWFNELPDYVPKKDI